MIDDEIYDHLLRSVEDWADQCDHAATSSDPVGALRHLALNMRQCLVSMDAAVEILRRREQASQILPD
jgi:hypothetical protein